MSTHTSILNSKKVVIRMKQPITILVEQICSETAGKKKKKGRRR